LCRCDVHRKREQKLAGYALLNRQARTGVLLGSPDCRVNGEVRKPCEPFHLAAELAAEASHQHGLGSQTGRGVSVAFSRCRDLSKGKQIDDVDRRERRIGSIGGAQIFHGTDKIQVEIVLADRRLDREVDHRFCAERIRERNDPVLDFIPMAEKEDFSPREIRTAQDDGLSCCPTQAEIAGTL